MENEEITGASLLEALASMGYQTTDEDLEEPNEIPVPGGTEETPPKQGENEPSFMKETVRFEELTPEGQAVYKQFQRGFTKSMQELAEQKRILEAEKAALMGGSRSPAQDQETPQGGATNMESVLQQIVQYLVQTETVNAVEKAAMKAGLEFDEVANTMNSYGLGIQQLDAAISLTKLVKAESKPAPPDTTIPQESYQAPPNFQGKEGEGLLDIMNRMKAAGRS